MFVIIVTSESQLYLINLVVVVIKSGIFYPKCKVAGREGRKKV